MKNHFIAHRSETEQLLFEQLLSEHLLEVAKICGEIGKKINMEYTCFLIGLCHDMGKYAMEFQKHIRKIVNIQVNHSSAGGIFLYDRLMTETPNHKYIIEVIAYTIFAHHGLFDLININSENIAVFSSRLNFKNEKVESYYQVTNIFEKEISGVLHDTKYKSIDNLIKLTCEEIKSVTKNLFNLSKKSATADNYSQESFYYYLHCLMRLLISILKEGDIHDSANVFLQKKDRRLDTETSNKVFRNGLKGIEKKYQEFGLENNTSLINQVRTKLSVEAKKNSSYFNYGLTKAELPTGSGKTLLTMRFALHNAVERQCKDRIFYVTAFLSVLEQNASEIKALFDIEINKDELILEHHSNVIQHEENDYDNGLKGVKSAQKHYKRQYLTESWETPVILTTMVQYCNAQFKGKASQIRRFCKFINSTVIIDEIQSLPIKVTYMQNLMTNFMTHIMHATIIHTTATQPEFDISTLNYKMIYNHKLPELVRFKKNEKNVFNRVKAFYIKNNHDNSGIFNLSSLYSHIENTIQQQKSVLIILNTKTAVDRLYNQLKHLDNQICQVTNLTTNKTADHRLSEIEIIKKKISVIRSEKRHSLSVNKLICVSTQLIEAGVDVDFDVVYRSMAGIPSLIQAMGRCNREGTLEYGLFYIFSYYDENLNSLLEIKREKERTKELVKDKLGKQIYLENLKKQYYQSLYLNNESALYYTLSNKNNQANRSSLFGALSRNSAARGEYNQITGKDYPYNLAQDFKKVSSFFELIDDQSISVVVQYSQAYKTINVDSFINNNKLINQLQIAYNNDDYNKVKSIQKKLQPYTISVKNIDELDAYINIIGDVFILRSAYYDIKKGLNCSELETLIL